MSTKITKRHINDMRMNYKCTIWFCKILVVILIGVGVFIACNAVEHQDWLKLVLDAFFVPIAIGLMKLHDSETKSYVDFTSKVNDAQVIANDQSTMAKLIRLSKIGK